MAVIFIILLIAASTLAIELRDNAQSAKAEERLLELVAKQCLKNSNTDILHELKKAMKEMHLHLLEGLPIFEKINNTSTAKFCTTKRDNFTYYLDNSMKILEKCLDSEVVYLPHILVEMSNITFNYLCDRKITIDEITERVMIGVQWMFGLAYHGVFLRCHLKSNLYQDLAKPNYKDLKYSKTRFCTDLQHMKTCIVDEVQEMSLENPIEDQTKELLDYINLLFAKYFELCDQENLIK